MLLIVAIAFNATSVSAYDYGYDFEYNGMYFKVTNLDPAECAITKGETAYKGDFVIPETVKYKGRDVKVTAISKDAFHYCSDLISAVVWPHCPFRVA